MPTADPGGTGPGAGFGPGVVHLCIDMQRLFGPDSPWTLPWMGRILSAAVRLAEHDPARTVFTRFIPPRRAEDAGGTWRPYFEKWPEVTREHMDDDLLRLVPALERFAPPARVLDKPVYSPWHGGGLDRLLEGRGIHTVILSGGETDICVLAAVFGAVDRGYRVILASDALCSAFDATHDAAMRIYRRRLTVQVEVLSVADILARGAAAGGGEQTAPGRVPPRQAQSPGAKP